MTGWEQVLPANQGPAARFDHVTAYDPAGDRLVIFGGRGDSIFSDTWVYEIAGNRWNEVAGEGPPQRFGVGAAYDTSRSRILLFGGQGSGDLFYDDVWAFDLETLAWQRLDTSGGPPPARYGTSAIVDEMRGRLVISHGFTFAGRFDDTWALDLETLRWQEITPDGLKPLKRCLHEAVYDPAEDRMLLFGGCSSGFGPCPQGDLWSFDLASHQWAELTPEVGPSPVSNPSLAFDQVRRRGLLFGGNSAEGPISDLWALDGSTDAWMQVHLDGPSPRRSHDAALDSRGRLWLLGGTGDERYGDLWRLTHSA